MWRICKLNGGSGMRKKSLKIYVALSIFLLAVAGYFITDYFLVKQISSDAEHVLFENAEEAINAADIVIEVRATNESQGIVEDMDGFFSGHTLTEVEVLNVLVNKSGDEIDSRLTVAEPYIKTERGLGTEFYTYEDYTPMKNQMKYILLLKWGEGINEYWVQSLEQGKINIDGKDEEERAKYANNSQYVKLAQSIREKFDKE